jgi:hypothetical protein
MRLRQLVAARHRQLSASAIRFRSNFIISHHDNRVAEKIFREFHRIYVMIP